MSEPYSVFSPNDATVQASVPPVNPASGEASTTLGAHINERRWCAWATRDRHGKPTKVPFFRLTPHQNEICEIETREIEARSNDPSTWLKLPRAYDLSCAMGVENNVGIFLGINEIISDHMMGGVDYDTCFISDGKLAWWAAEAQARFNTYAEISPSGAGIKQYFLYPTVDCERISEFILPAKTGRQFKMHSEAGNHPPGIEWYFRGRFFAVTGNHYAGSPATINAITFDDLVWLTKDLGPRLAGRKLDRRAIVRNASGHVLVPTGSERHDYSRSGDAFKAACQLRRVEGLQEYEEIKGAMLNHPDPRVQEWMREKGLDRNEHEFENLFENSKPRTSSDKLRCRFAQMQREIRLSGEDWMGNPTTTN